MQQEKYTTLRVRKNNGKKQRGVCSIMWGSIIKCLLLVALVVGVSSCAMCDGKLFLGWGSYKTEEFEIESDSPIQLPKVEL